MIGIRRDDLSLLVGKIPERKRPMIMIEKGNKSFCIGQVRTAEDGELLIKMIEYLCGNDKSGDDVRDAMVDWGND